jgi:hypothetical protein
MIACGLLQNYSSTVEAAWSQVERRSSGEVEKDHEANRHRVFIIGWGAIRSGLCLD